MKLVTYLHGRREHVGFIFQDCVYSLRVLDGQLPVTVDAFLRNWDHYFPLAKETEKLVMKFPALQATGFLLSEIQLLAPVSRPTSCRDGYAFRQHVATARRNRGLQMIAEFDEYPVFYFSNHHSVIGPGLISCMPDHFEKLDFELEVAVVISKKGRNIRAENANQYIAGLMIMNDFSARTLQMEEMLLNLGPAKGKDFATATGPWLVTPDELKLFEVPCKENHVGKSWNLKMSASVNGEKVSEGNLADMDWTYAEIIERASYGVDLYPGDIIGSGTVGTGCFLELNGTGKLSDPGYPERWLQPGDEIKLSVEGLGELRNVIIPQETDFSILKKKKNQIIL